MDITSKYSDLIHHLDEYEKKAKNEPGHYLFLKEGVLCFDDEKSDARFPYVKDGMTFWAHQNGKNHLNESDFFLLPETTEGEASYCSLFLGIKGEEDYHPYSLFSYDKNLFDGYLLRATLFSYHDACYLLKKEDLLLFVVIALDEEKNWILRGKVINQGKEEKDIYTSFFFNPMLMHSNYTTVETKWFKKCEYDDSCFHFETTEDISREEHLFHSYFLHRETKNVMAIENTTSRLVYSQSKTAPITSSRSLLKGKFEEEKNVTCFSDLAIAGDFLSSHLKPREEMDFSYILSKKEDHRSFDQIDSYLSSLKQEEMKYDLFSFQGGEDAGKMTSFSKMLLKQVDYCATTKNSTLTMLGYRDIFQALEAGVIFDSEMVRGRIIDCLNYTCLNGRCPRQFAWSNGKEVRVDSREFIDQGLWVIDCLYQYLSYTGDDRILKEKASYITIRKDKTAYREDIQEDIYHHVKRILCYLISNLDETTGCLRTLYGDWNDAIDGLGRSSEGKEFSDGVSIMASFQLYSALKKAEEIIDSFVPDDRDFKKEIEKALSILHEGLLHHAFIEKDGKVKIVHGWGEHQSFFVGSFSDIDGKERDTLTSNAFYVLSGFSKEEKQYKDAVLQAYQRLEGKYGFKTFEPYFGREASRVGRIVNLPKGTAENAATYIHGSVFALDSLFVLGESHWAFDEMKKLLPINHDFISTTPFVMPNSYVYNPEIGCDGESMNDWFTGSSSTILKSLVRNAFGFDPHINGLVLHLTPYFPYPEAQLNLNFRGKKIRILHQGENAGSIVLDGVELSLAKDGERLSAFVPYESIQDGSLIEVK